MVVAVVAAAVVVAVAVAVAATYHLLCIKGTTMKTKVMTNWTFDNE